MPHAAIGENHVSAKAVVQRLQKELRSGEEQLPVTMARPPERARRQLLEDQQCRGMNDQLHPDDVHRQVEERISEQRNRQGGHHERHVNDQEVLKARPEIGKELTPLTDRSDDRAKVVVEQHDRGYLSSAPRAALTHRDADVGGLERRHVVYSIAGDGNDLAGLLERANERQLLGWRGAGDDVDSLEILQAPARGHLLHLVARHDARLGPTQPDFSRNRARRDWVVTRDHDGVNPGQAACADRVGHSRAHRILEGDDPS